MRSARSVFEQNDGDVTKAYYAELAALGPDGQVAVALFRAQKRSSRAKEYRPGKFRRAAYDVKSWSMGEVVRLVAEHGEKLGIRCGWKADPSTRFDNGDSWVLYVDLPQGQVSFHSPTRLSGPDYPGDWCGEKCSAERILAFCDSVSAAAAA